MDEVKINKECLKDEANLDALPFADDEEIDPEDIVQRRAKIHASGLRQNEASQNGQQEHTTSTCISDEEQPAGVHPGAVAVYPGGHVPSEEGSSRSYEEVAHDQQNDDSVLAQGTLVTNEDDDGNEDLAKLVQATPLRVSLILNRRQVAILVVATVLVATAVGIGVWQGTRDKGSVGEQNASNDTVKNEGPVGGNPVYFDDDEVEALDDDFSEVLLSYHPQLAPLPDNIDTVCDPTQPISERNGCKAICDEAKCCKLPEKMEGSCLQGNHLLCLQYHRKCADFESPNQVVTILTNIRNPPQNLLDLCSPFSLSTETGYKQCFAQCAQAKCCYSLDETDPQCRQLDKCNLWAPCFNLRAHGYVSEDIQLTVSEKCAVDKMTTIEGRSQCQQVCLQHTCCIHNGVCKEQNPTACDQYEPCTILFDEQGNPKPLADTLSLPSNIANDCSESMIAAGSKAQCSALCQKGDCCKIPSNLGTSCLTGNEETCASFHRFCSVLESNIGTQESTAVAEFDPAPAKLSQWCSPNSLASSNGRAHCQNACEPAKCCWSTDISLGESCRSNQLCLDYRWCLHLAAASTVNQAVTNTVGSVCSLASIREPGGIEVCLTACDVHSCCWDGNYIPNDDQGIGFEVDDELIDDQFRSFADDSINQVDDEFFDDAFLGDDANAFDPTDLGGDCFDPDVCEQFQGCLLLQG